MRWSGWVLALAAFGVGAAVAAPAVDRRVAVELHHRAARALLAVGDLDGAWLEMRAAYRQSCDERIAGQLALIEQRRRPVVDVLERDTPPLPARRDVDELATVRVGTIDDLAPVRVPPRVVSAPAQDEEDELAPVPRRVIDTAPGGVDELAPVRLRGR